MSKVEKARLEGLKVEWRELATKLEALSDEIREMPRSEAITPDCQLLAEATATVMNRLSSAIKNDVRPDPWSARDIETSFAEPCTCGVTPHLQDCPRFR
jgi:hypothetical protein